jgi:ABC-type branched-subunit amino acid transport system ATPase component/MFS family permease
MDTMPTVAEVETARERVRASARAAMGVTGTKDTPPLREGIRASGVGWYPLVALGFLVVVDEFQAVALTVLGPEIASSLGISKSVLASLLLLKTLVIMVAVLPMAAYVQNKPRRAQVSIVMAFGWSICTLATGFVISPWGLMAVLVADGFTTGSVRAVHEPLLVDSYPTSVRARALGAYRAANSVGMVLAPLTIAVTTTWFDMTWRGVLVVSGLICLVAAVVSLRLRDPGFGTFDTDLVRQTVRADGNADDGASTVEGAELGFFEIARRLLLIPTIRRILAAYAVLGMLLVPLTTFLAFYLQERWGLTPGSRALFSALTPLFAIGALAVMSDRIESMFRVDPARVVRLAGAALALAILSIVAGVAAPVFPLVFVFFGIALAMVAVMQPALTIATFAIVPAAMRPHMAALLGIFLAAVGGGGGLLLLGSIDSRFGTAGALVSLAVPGVVAGLILRTAARTVNADLDRMLDEIVEEEEIAALRRAGSRPPLLACRNVSFSYGQLQVLFDVDFTVDDGEMVALLGTNGAGKSTLLKVISGIGFPSAGSVRLDGTDITYLDPDRRVRLGVSQVPGGKAVFGPMSVVENLRALAFTLGTDTATIQSGIDATFEAFPRLAERRNQLASTLSGGEQQMLGLATAFLVRPRLLLIDELSLGLAPKIVGELLDMVRRINAAGTAIVLVEQSVNLALSVVHHAYFMEKGQVRFDGPAQELLHRPDLLRSVFLEGASKGLGGGTR